MTAGAVDVVWRGLDSAGGHPLQPASATEPRSPDGQRLHRERPQLAPESCNSNGLPTSPMRSNKALRQAIAVALQGDRTSDSIVPTGVVGHIAAFPLGGKASPKVTWKNRINLTLGFDASMPEWPGPRDADSQPTGEHRRTGACSSGPVI